MNTLSDIETESSDRHEAAAPEKKVSLASKSHEVDESDESAADETPAENLEASETSNDEETGADDDGGEEPATEVRPKKKGGFQKRIEKLNKRASTAEQRALAAESELERLREAAKTQRPNSEKTELRTETKLGEPSPDNFEHSADYLKALVKWQSAEDRKTEKEAVEKDAQKKAGEKLHQQFRSSIDTAKDAYDDYDEVLEAAEDIQVPDALRGALFESENAGELMYQLCKNREEYEKIVKLPAEKIERALGRFEEKLQGQSTSVAKKEIKTTKAPEPIVPVASNSPGSKRALDEMDIDEFIAHRNAQPRRR